MRLVHVKAIPLNPLHKNKAHWASQGVLAAARRTIATRTVITAASAAARTAAATLSSAVPIATWTARSAAFAATAPFRVGFAHLLHRPTFEPGAAGQANLALRVNVRNHHQHIIAFFDHIARGAHLIVGEL